MLGCSEETALYSPLFYLSLIITFVNNLQNTSIMAGLNLYLQDATRDENLRNEFEQKTSTEDNVLSKVRRITDKKLGEISGKIVSKTGIKKKCGNTENKSKEMRKPKRDLAVCVNNCPDLEYLSDTKENETYLQAKKLKPKLKKERFSIRIDNLPPDVTQKELQELIKPVGLIKKCFIATDKATGKGEGFAYINFKFREHVEQAIEKLNGYKLDNCILTVKDWSC